MASPLAPTRPGRLTSRPADDAALFRRWRSRRDPNDHAALVERFLPLAHHLALRYRTGGEREDLLQVAAVGLLSAIDRYDPDRGVAFTSFAVPTILGELRRYFRDHGWAIRVPRELQELGKRCQILRDELTPSLGRAPTVEELADACGTTAERVVEALSAARGHYAVSLNEPRPQDEEGEALDGLTCEEPGYDRVESTLAFRRLLQPLPPRERQMMLLRFEDEMTQQEIANVFGTSQMHVSRVLARCLKQLASVG
jgi:RNA polymerase sigma-B factor